MSSRTEKERQKQIQDKCQNLLNEMLKDEDNKYCVDCDAKGPRWASWNLGIFLCIRCAGIHRKLGVHISRVKSVNLDTWTPQQVVCLQQMGNSRARAVYEANLPDSFRRPQNEGPLESFIRAKYEQKKYIAREWVPPPLPKIDWDKELEEEAEKLKKKKREMKSSNVATLPPFTPAVTPQPLPKPVSCSPKPSRVNSHCTDLLGLDTPTREIPSQKTSSDSDLFTTFLNASLESSSNSDALLSSASRSEEENNFFNQSIPSVSNKQQQLTKDSILALYGNPSGVYNISAQAPATMPLMFNSSIANGVGNSFPQPINSNLSSKNDALGIGAQFSTSITATSAMVFPSNPFYSMAASGIQSDFSSQKLSQRMDALNLNNSTPNSLFPASNQFEMNGGDNQQQKNLNQSVPTSNFWQ